jgi:Ni/Co efflux regulator RcnB
MLQPQVVQSREQLTMKNQVFAGVATTALLLTATAVSASDSFAPVSRGHAAATVDVAAAGAKPGGMHMPRPGGNMGGHMGGGMHGPKPGGHMGGGMGGGGMHGPKPGGHQGGGYHGPRGNWHGGHNAPGGYGGYRRPFRGFMMPRYWINPGFYVNNYSTYGLRAPTNGYNWSRYYDDAVLTDRRGYVYDSVSNVPWQSAPAYNAQPAYSQPAYAPALSTDQSVYNEFDLPQNAETEGGTYQGQWTGAYVDDRGETYRGQWQGNYEGDDGRTYEGTYRGTATGAPVYSGGTGPGANYGYDRDDQRPDYDDQPYPAPQQPTVSYGNGGDRGYSDERRYTIPGGYESYERCLRTRGITGGAIGAILGGVAGNRIAGRGDRLAGSLIGGGIGAIAGVGVERLANKCTKYLPRPQYQPQVSYPQPRPAPQGYPQNYPQGYPAPAYGWTPGYYYPQQPAPITTITVTPGNMTTTTTTTEEVIYENVYTRAPMMGKGLRRPVRSNKSCGC